jgi:hypothetical protein
MNDMEKLIWAAAFAAEWQTNREFNQNAGVAHLSIDSISGFSCAEVADVALEHYREAIKGADAEYLIPVKEKWL